MLATRKQKPGRSPVAAEHVVQFYENDRFLAECVAGFAAGAWQQGRPVLLITSQAHRKALERTFKAHAYDPRVLAGAGLLAWRDVRSLLPPIAPEGTTDEARIGQQLAKAIDSTRQAVNAGPVHVVSELVDFVWQSGNADAAMRLEAVWNSVIERCPCSLLCACDLRHFDHASDAAGLAALCRHHRRAVPSESYRDDSPAEERQLSVLALQQRARALETEKRQHRVLEQWLRRALVARRAHERAQSNMARAHITHELKTPLNTILGWTQMLKGGQTDERTLHQAIEVIGRNARELNVLIDGLIKPESPALAPTT